MSDTEFPYTVNDLDEKWQFISPAGRLETVTRITTTPAGLFTLVWTDKTTDLGWLLRSSQGVHAYPPRPLMPADPTLFLRMIDAKATSTCRARMWVVLAAKTARFPWSDSTDMSVHAEYLGKGLGWRVMHRGVTDASFQLESEPFPDKASARARVKELMRLLGKGLNLKVGPDMPSE